MSVIYCEFCEERVDTECNAEHFIADTEHCLEQVRATAPELLEALEYYKQGVENFYTRINFGASFLDAEAIEYMNKVGSKINQAITKATKI